MKAKSFFVLLWIILAFSGFTFAQRKRVPKKNLPLVISVRENYELIPKIRDFAFVINIDDNSNVSFAIQNSEKSNFLLNSGIANPLTDFFSKFYNLEAARNSKDPFEPIIIIQPSAGLSFSELIKVIHSSRISENQKIKVQFPSGFYSFIPQLQSPEDSTLPPRPNPLTLIIKLEKNGNLFLNKYESGTLEEPAQLMDKLKEIFKNRDDYGVFRKGTNLTEKTVYIKAPLSVQFSEVIRLAELLRDAGADPIGLQVDDLAQ